MSYRLDPSLYPSPNDSWFKKATLLVGAVVLAVEETARGAADSAKREQAIDLFMRYVTAFGVDIPYVPSWLEDKILRKVAGILIDRLAGLVKRARSRS